ncbi:MAG: S8 family serine peptidase, partial [Verrucomicrobiota bacterium]|nr:S8 family serine peptidase [Verrucomicrobiota bacterium]
MLTFKSPEAYRRFLARAEKAGLTVLAQIDQMKAVRVHYDSLDPLQRELEQNAGDYADVTANYIFNLPQPPKDARAPHAEVPIGNSLLDSIGVASSDPSQWGRGVTIAVLDSGVVPSATLGAGRLQYLDLGLGNYSTNASDLTGHGTAVAALAAGSTPDAQGVAPSARILS